MYTLGTRRTAGARTAARPPGSRVHGRNSPDQGYRFVEVRDLPRWQGMPMLAARDTSLTYGRHRPCSTSPDEHPVPTLHCAQAAHRTRRPQVKRCAPIPSHTQSIDRRRCPPPRPMHGRFGSCHAPLRVLLDGLGLARHAPARAGPRSTRRHRGGVGISTSCSGCSPSWGRTAGGRYRTLHTTSTLRVCPAETRSRTDRQTASPLRADTRYGPGGTSTWNCCLRRTRRTATMPRRERIVTRPGSAPAGCCR